MPRFVAAARCATDWTELALVKRTQSNSCQRWSAASSGAKFSGVEKATSGKEIGMAPRRSSLVTRSELCSTARVMTMRWPKRAEAAADARGERSATLAAHFLQDGLGAGVDEEAAHVFAEGAGLIERSGGALADVLNAVDAADAGFEDEFVAFDASPGAQGNLAAAFECAEERAFGNDCAARFGVVEFFERDGSFGVVGAAFDADGALADRGEKGVGRENLGDAMRCAETIEAGFGEHDGVV